MILIFEDFKINETLALLEAKESMLMDIGSPNRIYRINGSDIERTNEYLKRLIGCKVRFSYRDEKGYNQRKELKCYDIKATQEEFRSPGGIIRNPVKFIFIDNKKRQFLLNLYSGMTYFKEIKRSVSELDPFGEEDWDD